MRKPSKCRSCNYVYEYSHHVTRHKLVDAGFACPLCKATRMAFHPQGDDLSGEAYECVKCHNYILYTEGPKITKDEIYFPELWVVIRDVENNSTYFSIDDERIYVWKKVLPFETKEELFNKLKTVVVFS